MSKPAPVQRDADGRPVAGWRTSAALSPRALPTDTSVRFLLLIAAVVAASLYLYEALWVVLRGEALLDPVRDCEMGSPGAADSTVLLGPQGECRAGTDPEQAAFAVTGTVVVLLAAYGIYRLLPLLRTRRSRLVRLDQDDAAALHEDVRQAVADAGLEQEPEVMVDAANPAVQAFAYGTARHPRLGLTGGLVVLQVVDPPAFRAVLRHEIAHLANRDVPWTYYTVATWWSFVALALAPVVAVFVVSDIRYVLRLGWRTLLLAVLVLLVRNAVLRAREIYADARAAEWRAGPDLDRVLRMQPVPSGRRHPLLRLHPPADARRRLLAHPEGLFGVDGSTALAAGLAAGTAYATIRAVADLALPSAVASVGAALLVAPLLATVVTAGAWRAELRSVVRGVPVPVNGPLTLGTGIGLVAGPLLSFQAAAGGLVVGVDGAGGYVVWAAVTLLSTGLVAWYAAAAGRLAVEAGLRRSSPWPLPRAARGRGRGGLRGAAGVRPPGPAVRGGRGTDGRAASVVAVGLLTLVVRGRRPPAPRGRRPAGRCATGGVLVAPWKGSPGRSCCGVAVARTAPSGPAQGAPAHGTSGPPRVPCRCGHGRDGRRGSVGDHGSGAGRGTGVHGRASGRLDGSTGCRPPGPDQRRRERAGRPTSRDDRASRHGAGCSRRRGSAGLVRWSAVPGRPAAARVRHGCTVRSVPSANTRVARGPGVGE